MGQGNVQLEPLIGREAELRRLRTELHNRQSRLIWGATDAGKTFLIKKALLELLGDDDTGVFLQER